MSRSFKLRNSVMYKNRLIEIATFGLLIISSFEFIYAELSTNWINTSYQCKGEVGVIYNEIGSLAWFAISVVPSLFLLIAGLNMLLAFSSLYFPTKEQGQLKKAILFLVSLIMIALLTFSLIRQIIEINEANMPNNAYNKANDIYYCCKYWNGTLGCCQNETCGFTPVLKIASTALVRLFCSILFVIYELFILIYAIKEM